MVLRECCRTIRIHYLHVGKMEVCLKSMTIASACNKAFREKFLQTNRICLIPIGDYMYNRKQSKWSIAWLTIEERKENEKIPRGRKGKERQLPELTDIRAGVLCKE